MFSLFSGQPESESTTCVRLQLQTTEVKNEMKPQMHLQTKIVHK